MYKLSKLSLVLCACVGLLFGYMVTKAFIIDINILQFILIEIVISLLHSTYNRVKVKII